MPKHDHPIVNGNFILKRVGDILYLPFIKEISYKATPNLPTLPYFLCKTDRFDENSGLLSLKLPEYRPYDKRDYEKSVETNSDTIIAHDVKAFDILGAPPTEPIFYYPAGSNSSVSPDEWKQ